MINSPASPRPFFSVVMPVYNGERYVSETIESVLAQTDPDWELVIVDDFSGDRTSEILAAYSAKDKRLRGISNQENRKAAGSLNRGIRAARGEWIAHIDADDIFTPDYLKTLRPHAEKAAFECFFSSWITVIDESSVKILDVRLPKAGTIQRMMKNENFLYHSGTIFSRQLWEKVGGYPEEDLTAAEDAAMWNRFFEESAKLVMIPEFLVKYRLHQTNMTSVKDAKLFLSSTAAARDQRMIRQNHEWRASLYLKQRMLKPARTEILEIGRTQKSLSLKNIQYYLLTFLPDAFAAFYMWEIRPRARSFFKKLWGSTLTPAKAA